MKKIDVLQAEASNIIYDHYLDKRKNIMKSTEISYHEITGDISGKGGITGEQITELFTFLAKMMWIFFKWRYMFI